MFSFFLFLKAERCALWQNYEANKTRVSSKNQNSSKKIVTTLAKRETASFLVERWSLSVRQAYRLVHLSRTVFHYQAVPNDDNEVKEALRDLARKHPKYGCTMLTGIIRARGFALNHKRVERIYQEENLALRRKRKGKKVVVERTPLAVPS